jgi:hypothetical protein
VNLLSHKRSLTLTALLTALVAIGAQPEIKEWVSGIVWPEPAVIDPGSAAQAPSDAIVLFDGRDLSAWEGGEKWEIADGYAVSKGDGITTKQQFGDIQLHLEFATPSEVKGNSQGRGNSGVYLMGQYELQILDSYDNETYFDGQCGAIYKQTPPMVNACRKPGEWQTYDVIWTAPKFSQDGTSLVKPATMTALQNGVVIQNHYELQGGTFWHQPPHYTAHPEKGPIHLQFHGNPVRFRNIWVRELKPIVGTKPNAEGK